MKEPAPGAVALRGLCPRCAAKTLYEGLAGFAPKCRTCGLDFAGFDVGDGPAAFLVLIIGALVTGLAVWLELSAEPPFWVHILLWLPLTVIAVVGSLRFAKGLLLALEWSGRQDPGMADDCRGQSSPDQRNRAREGRISG